MSFSLRLWQKLPAGLLRMKFKAWNRLDFDVKLLIFELAEKQEYKCAHCNQGCRLEIEHDHEPEHGSGDEYTVYNIRGLACRRCNWHLRLYEKNKIGEFWNWENAESHISDNEYERYIDDYECRVRSLLEPLLEEKLGSDNYWRRRSLVGKFDDWKAGRLTYPWCWGFEEIKDKRYGRIRTPKQFMGTLVALMQFVAEEKKKDPDCQPPERFFELMERVRPVLEIIKANHS